MGRRYPILITWLLLLVAASTAQAQNNAESLIQQAQVQSEAGNVDQAISLLNQAIQLAPDSSLAYTRLGGMQLLQRDYSSGIKNFQQAIMLDGQNADAFIGLSVAYLHLGRYSLAREALKEASRLGPDKQQEINNVLAWLDQRDRQRPAGH
jgi:Flp pilus assembly protein TadD